MFVFTAVVAGLFGLVIGSFLNVVIYRYNTGAGLNGRSGCLTCGKTLRWYELIPLGSFLIQKGRCRGCSTKLSWQYPLVELITGLIFVAVYLKYFQEPVTGISVLHAAIMILAWCILVVILVYDVRHKIIPDGFVYTFAGLGLLKILSMASTYESKYFLIALMAGPILFLPFYLLWLVSDGRWIGLGDGKLALGIGWMLGLGLGISAIVLAFWVGALVSIVLMVIMRLKKRGKNLTMKSEIPFAPFLIIGFAIVYFLGIDVIGIHTIFLF